MIDKKVIKKVMTRIFSIRCECAEIHKVIKRTLTDKDVQAKIAYIKQEENNSIYNTHIGRFSKDENGIWYCYIDGGHKSSKDYEIMSSDELVEDFLKDFERYVSNKTEDAQIGRLRSRLEYENSNLGDYRAFVTEKMPEILRYIDLKYNAIKTEREAAVAKLLADFNL